jgi:hypothetical protein
VGYIIYVQNNSHSHTHTVLHLNDVFCMLPYAKCCPFVVCVSLPGHIVSPSSTSVSFFHAWPYPDLLSLKSQYSSSEIVLFILHGHSRCDLLHPKLDSIGSCASQSIKLSAMASQSFNQQASGTNRSVHPNPSGSPVDLTLRLGLSDESDKNLPHFGPINLQHAHANFISPYTTQVLLSLSLSLYIYIYIYLFNLFLV